MGDPFPTRSDPFPILNLFESAMQKQASRIAGLKSPGRDDLKRILASDVIAATSRSGIAKDGMPRSSR